jgi:hypothetical protein
LVLILRWYWWRINAYSELLATLAPIALVFVLLLLQAFGVETPVWLTAFPTNLFVVVAFTTVIWLIATYVTQPTDAATLDRFYERVRPGGPGWKPVAVRNPGISPEADFGRLIIDWLVGVVLVYSTLFGVGYLIFQRTFTGIICLIVAAAATAYLWKDLNRHESGMALASRPGASTRLGEHV